MKDARIAAVVVTYNRLQLLQECITSLKDQLRPADEIVIINNGSTDGTADWLASQNNITVITQQNAGSSGGQYTGVKYAIDKNYDWVWCMDDDTIPIADALEAFVSSEYFISSTSFLCSAVLWKDKTFHNMNRPLLRAGGYEEIFHMELKSSEIIYSSFVSVFKCCAQSKAVPSCILSFSSILAPASTNILTTSNNPELTAW